MRRPLGFLSAARALKNNAFQNKTVSTKECLCARAHTHTHGDDTYIYIYIHTYIHTHVCVWVCVCVYLRKNTIYIYIYVCVFVCVRVCCVYDILWYYVMLCNLDVCVCVCLLSYFLQESSKHRALHLKSFEQGCGHISLTYPTKVHSIQHRQFHVITPEQEDLCLIWKGNLRSTSIPSP